MSPGTSRGKMFEHHLIWIFVICTLFAPIGNCQNATDECAASGGTTPEVQAQRLEEVPTYLNVMSSIGEYDNITLQQQSAATYLVPESSIEVSGVGLFPGEAEVLEYSVLTNPSLNGERLVILNKTVLNYTWTTPDELLLFTQDYWQINDDKGNEIEVVPGNSQETLKFVPCSTKVLLDSTTLDPTVADAFQKDIFSAITPDQVCLLAQVACPGDLFPYSSLQDCENFMSSIPMSCNDGEHMLQGNTTYCRFLHATAATIAPLVHCQHVAIDSTFCLQQDCNNGEYSSSYGERIPGLFNKAAVLIVAFLIVLLPSLFNGVVIISGRWQDLDTITDYNRTTNNEARLLNGSKDVDEVKLSVDDYRYETSDGITLVRDVTFTANMGDIVALMGPSGAGKTTLLKSLAKQLEGKASGDMLVYAGKTIDTEHHISYVEQHPSELAMALPHLTVEESLISHARTVALMKGGEYAEGIKDLLEKLYEILSLKPFLKTKLKFLSGGQQKRWRVAKEMLNRPSVLLLDEPTSGLDSSAALQLMCALKSLSNNMIIVCTIHQPSNSVLGMFSHVLLLQRGGTMLQYTAVKNIKSVISTLETTYRMFKENNAYLPACILDAVLISFAELDPARKGYILSRESEEAGRCSGLSLDMLGSILQASKNPGDFESITDTSQYIQKMVDSGSHQDIRSELKLFAIALQRQAGLTDEGVRLHMPPWAIGESYSDSLLAFCESGLCRTCAHPLGSCQCADAGYTNLLKGALSKQDSVVFQKKPWDHSISLRKIIPVHKRLGFIQWLRVTEQFSQESFRGSPPVERLVYFAGSLINAGMLALLFPQVEVDDLRTLYYFPASLLVGLSVFANLVFLNQVYVKISRERNLLRSAHASPHDSCGLRLVSGLLARSAGNWIALIAFFFLYYYVVGWNITNEFGRWAASFLTAKLMLDIQSVFATIAFTYLPASVGLGVTGAWLGWNVLFGGVLLRMGAMLVIWKYWSLYVTPFYHLINAWMVSALKDVPLSCPPTAQPGTCPGGGNWALEYFGYNAVSQSVSIIVLFSTLLLYAAVLTVLIFWKKPYSLQ